jgi:hypothetical protein
MLINPHFLRSLYFDPGRRVKDDTLNGVDKETSFLINLLYNNLDQKPRTAQNGTDKETSFLIHRKCAAINPRMQRAASINRICHAAPVQQGP